MSRAEAFAALDIDKAELMDTGEIKLPNGKIIGHRQFKHIYRQRLRIQDEKETALINKLAIEYGRIREYLKGASKYQQGRLMLTDGGSTLPTAKINKDVGRAQKKAEDRQKHDRMRLGIRHNKL